MGEHNGTTQEQLERISRVLTNLEQRVEKIEAHLNIAPGIAEEAAPLIGISDAKPSVRLSASGDSSLEMKIGGYWLAHAGTIVLLMGIVFLTSYPLQILPAFVRSLMGYMAVVLLFGVSKRTGRVNEDISQILFAGAIVLLYVTTLRLHFLTAEPLISSKAISLSLVVAVLAAQVYTAAKRQSLFLSGLTVFMIYATAIIGDAGYFSYALITLAPAYGVFLLIRNGWQSILTASVISTYFVHLILLFNNPLLGNSFGIVDESHGNLFFLIATTLLFATGHLLHGERTAPDLPELLLAGVNCLGLFLVGWVTIHSFYGEVEPAMNSLLGVCFLAIAIAYWLRYESRFAAAVYACFGFLAFTVAVFAQFSSPTYFIWLGWLSLIVISAAIWFRSRIIIVVNSIIYLGIFAAYFQQADSNGLVNLSYALVALTSARLLNWKKERLELKTEFIRIVYLSTAFVSVLYGLYHAVPGNFVSLSWLGAALFYFGMSLLLHNRKYRWMGILTIFATILHIFIIDMARLDAAFRIFLFLAVGLILLGVSWAYIKYSKREMSAHSQD